MRPETIELYIEELVLDGFAPADRYRVGDAVESELQRLFVERGLTLSPGQSLDHAHLDAGSFQVAPGSRPETIGAQVARAVYDGGVGR